MADALEYPGEESSPDSGSLYLYRGGEVPEARPIFTGDVFFGVEVQTIGDRKQADILVVQHPCALRVNGIDLVDVLMVVEVEPHRLLRGRDWLGNYRLMPLPELVPGSQEPHRAARFTAPCLVGPSDLRLGKRVASMTPLGVNLLLQRWVYHNSRAIVPTHLYDDATSAQYEEADAVEEWCDIRSSRGVSTARATKEANAWLDNDGGIGITRRKMLENRQYRTPLRKALRKYARELEP